MKKLVRPVLVESKEPNNIYTLDGELYQTTPNTNIVVSKTDKLIPQQLILISLEEDEKIEVGDRCYCSIENRIIINQFHTNVPLTRKKVVATQEQLSPELIQQLVDEYNSGGMKEKEIEITNPTYDDWMDNGASPVFSKPKLTNGFITVVKKENKFGENKGHPILEDINVLLHSKKHCFSFPEGLREIQKEIINLFTSYKEPILYTEEEVKELIIQALLEVDTLVTTCGQRDGWVELNNKEVNNWFNKNKKK